MSNQDTVQVGSITANNQCFSAVTNLSSTIVGDYLLVLAVV